MLIFDIPTGSEDNSLNRFMSSFVRISSSIVASGEPSTIAAKEVAPSRDATFNQRLDYALKAHQMKIDSAKILIMRPDQSVRKEGVELLKILIRSFPTFYNIVSYHIDSDSEEVLYIGG